MPAKQQMFPSDPSEDDAKLLDYATSRDPKRDSTWQDRVKETNAYRMAQEAVDSLLLPGDVYSGEQEIWDPETGRVSDRAIERSAALAGTVTGGAGVVPADPNDLRAGIRAWHASPKRWETPQWNSKTHLTGERTADEGPGFYATGDKVVMDKYYFDQFGKFGQLDLNDDKLLDFQSNLGSDSNSNRFYEISRALINEEKADPATIDRIVESLLTREEVMIQSYLDDPDFAHEGERKLRLYKNVIEPMYLRQAEELKAIAASNPNGELPREGRAWRYDLDLDVDPDKMVDWNKPIMEHPKNVQDLYYDLLKSNLGPGLADQSDTPELRNLMMSTHRGGNFSRVAKTAIDPTGAAKLTPEQYVDLLRRYDVHGTRYPGVEKSGPYFNYVIPDAENRVRVLRGPYAEGGVVSDMPAVAARKGVAG